MAATPSIDMSGWLSEQLAQASPDLLREMITTFAQALMGAEADAVCGAPFGVRSPERSNTRNGYRPREWDTRAGTIGLAIPKLRQGSYSPIGCWSATAGPRPHWSRWWPPVICWGSRRGGWRSSSRPWASPG